MSSKASLEKSSSSLTYKHTERLYDFVRKLKTKVEDREGHSVPAVVAVEQKTVTSSTPSSVVAVYAYLDDLIIWSKNGDSHLAKLEGVLLKLREAGLKAKLTKCEFLKSKITFLGHTVDGDRIHTMDDKISEH